MGKPAARLLDTTAHGGMVVGPGSPTVFIGKMPAATMGDMHVCPMVTGVVPHVGGPIILGSTGVFIGKKPAARVGDMATCVGPPAPIVLGCMTVLIGEAGSGSQASSASKALGVGASKIKDPSGVQPMEPPPDLGPWTKLHNVHFQFVDSSKRPLPGIAYKWTTPHGEKRLGVSDAEGGARYSSYTKEGTYPVETRVIDNAKWSKTKAALGDELELTADADGFDEGSEMSIAVGEKTSGGGQRFIASFKMKLSGKKVKVKWIAALDGYDPEPPPLDKNKRENRKYFFVVYAEYAQATSKFLELETDLHVELVDELGQPVKDKHVEVTLHTGEVKTGKLDDKGKHTIEKIPAGKANISIHDGSKDEKAKKVETKITLDGWKTEKSKEARLLLKDKSEKSLEALVLKGKKSDSSHKVTLEASAKEPKMIDVFDKEGHKLFEINLK